MRIEGVEAIAIEIPLKRNFGGSTYDVLKRCTVVTRVATDAGLVSEVYNGDNRAHGGEIVRLIEEALAPRVRGLDVLEVERAWRAMFELSHASTDRKTLLEAMALGLCPVVAHYGGPGEIVDDATGIRVPLADRAALAERFRAALTRLADHPETAERLGAQARERVLRLFTWEAKAAQTLEVYRWVTGDRPEAPEFGFVAS